MRRRTITATLVTGVLWLAPWAEATAKPYLVYVGTYTGPQSKGIYAYRLMRIPESWNRSAWWAKLTRPSFLAIHPNRRKRRCPS